MQSRLSIWPFFRTHISFCFLISRCSPYIKNIAHFKCFCLFVCFPCNLPRVPLFVFLIFFIYLLAFSLKEVLLVQCRLSVCPGHLTPNKTHKANFYLGQLQFSKPACTVASKLRTDHIALLTQRYALQQSTGMTQVTLPVCFTSKSITSILIANSFQPGTS